MAPNRANSMLHCPQTGHRAVRGFWLEEWAMASMLVWICCTALEAPRIELFIHHATALCASMAEQVAMT